VTSGDLPGPAPAFPAVARDEASAGFFDAAARGELLVWRCARSGDVLGPPARACPACGSADLEPFTASGRGTLVTWAVVHQAPVPSLAPAVPYVTGVVELEEGAWLLVRLVDCDGCELRAGTPVSARFVPSGTPGDQPPGEVLVAFAPAAASR
jgi:hypothetical protein